MSGMRRFYKARLLRVLRVIGPACVNLLGTREGARTRTHARTYVEAGDGAVFTANTNTATDVFVCRQQ